MLGLSIQYSYKAININVTKHPSTFLSALSLFGFKFAYLKYRNDLSCMLMVCCTARCALCHTGGISAAVATRIIWPRLNVAVVPRWRCWFVSRQRILEVLAERKTLFRFHQKANWTHIHCAEGLDVYDKIKRLIRNVAISLKNAVTSLFLFFLGGCILPMRTKF